VLKKILVALDSSELSEQLIGVLQQLHLQPETNVVLAHVVVQLGANPDVAVDRPQAEVESASYQNLEKLQSYQAALPCQSELEIVTGGDPAEEIIRLANIHQTELIVIGSRGLTGMDRILQGSVSSQVVADAHCSVLVVKPVL
jgi:nucleotide-binding universal stress UspA family protein